MNAFDVITQTPTWILVAAFAGAVFTLATALVLLDTLL